MAAAAQQVAWAAPGRTATIVLGVLLFAALTAAGAAVRLPLPRTPVPLTLQTVPVLLAGAVLGPWWGSCSQLLYVLLGCAGAPIFAGGAGVVHLGGSTAGYLLGFVAAPWIVGRVAASGAQGAGRLALGTALGMIAILLLGCSVQALSCGRIDVALRQGLLPFISGDLLKWGMTTTLGAWWVSHRRDSGSGC